jgi:hypothetical protein
MPLTALCGRIRNNFPSLRNYGAYHWRTTCLTQVIGVGGCASHAIHQMCERGLGQPAMDLMVMNTDVQVRVYLTLTWSIGAMRP